ncbi:MAG: phytoene desaturase family protein [Dehalococcoidia bacterium]
MADFERKHVAIVGGGLAGLAAATYLARAGHRVSVFERSETLGGRAATTERDGYFHNMGPHALYRDGAGIEVLGELGIGYAGGSPDVKGVAVRNSRAYTLPTSGRTMISTRLFGVRARLEAGRQLLALGKAHEQSSTTVRDWLNTFSEPAARDYLEAFVRLATYSNAPEVISLADAAAQFAGATSGVLYLDGGWQTLVESLAQAAISAGATIQTGARVDGIERSGGRVAGLRAAGELLAADAVLLAVPPSVAAHLAPGVSALAEVADGAVPARAACLDIGLSRLPNARRKFALGIDCPFYFSVHSAWARLAPEGKVMASVAKYIPAGSAHDAERDLAELEAFLDIVQPGWRELEEHRQYLPNMVVTTSLPRAANGGIAGRPLPRVVDCQGLFIAGDWVAGGGWLTDATLGSSRAAAQAIAASLAERAPALASVS